MSLFLQCSNGILSALQKRSVFLPVAAILPVDLMICLSFVRVLADACFWFCASFRCFVSWLCFCVDVIFTVMKRMCVFCHRLLVLSDAFVLSAVLDVFLLSAALELSVSSIESSASHVFDFHVGGPRNCSLARICSIHGCLMLCFVDCYFLLKRFCSSLDGLVCQFALSASRLVHCKRPCR